VAHIHSCLFQVRRKWQVGETRGCALQLPEIRPKAQELLVGIYHIYVFSAMVAIRRSTHTLSSVPQCLFRTNALFLFFLCMYMYIYVYTYVYIVDQT
jgi:hypothetical protein